VQRRAIDTRHRPSEVERFRHVGRGNQPSPWPRSVFPRRTWTPGWLARWRRRAQCFRLSAVGAFVAGPIVPPAGVAEQRDLEAP
jgi:hypothetical protein